MRKIFHASPIPFAASVVLPLILLAAGCSRGHEASKQLTVTKGGLSVGFEPAIPPWHSGDATAVVKIADSATGMPVNDASVVATANPVAPKLQGSPASGRFQGSGRYEIPLRLVATKYSVDVHVERQGRPAVDVSFPLEAWQ